MNGQIISGCPVTSPNFLNQLSILLWDNNMNQLRLINDKLLLEYFVYATTYYQCKTFTGVDGNPFSSTADEIINEMVRRNLVERMDET
jgi:hypothetical protein